MSLKIGDNVIPYRLIAGNKEYSTSELQSAGNTGERVLKKDIGLVVKIHPSGTYNVTVEFKDGNKCDYSPKELKQYNSWKLRLGIQNE